VTTIWNEFHAHCAVLLTVRLSCRGRCKDVEARKTRMAAPVNFSRWLAKHRYYMASEQGYGRFPNLARAKAIRSMIAVASESAACNSYSGKSSDPASRRSKTRDNRERNAPSARSA